MLSLFALLGLVGVQAGYNGYSGGGHGHGNDNHGYTACSSATYDVVFVGGGFASVYGAMLVADVYQNASRSISIAVIEKNDYLGGNVLDVEVEAPAGYAAQEDKPLGEKILAGLGALRNPQLVNGILRRLANFLGIHVFFTPFRNQYAFRDVRKLCDKPYEHAIASDDPDSPYAWSDLCDAGLPYIDAVTGQGLYRGFIGNEDPAGSALTYVIRGAEYLTGESDIDANDNFSPNYYGDEGPGGTTGSGIHPYTGVRCEDAGPDDPDSPACPIRRAYGWDWKTFLEKEILEVPGTTLNQALGNFVQDDNFGFTGDFQHGNSAKGLIEYNLYEFNTNTFNSYPIGGMSEIIRRMRDRALATGLVQFFLKERVTKIDRTTEGGNIFKLKTSVREVRVRKFLGLNMPPEYLLAAKPTDPDTRFDGENLSGDVVTALRAIPELDAPQSPRVYKFVVQYEPGEYNFMWQIWSRNGSYSTRQFGNTGCTGRIEWVDTPIHRCGAFFTVVYSDYLCREKWEHFVELAGQSLAGYNILKNRVQEELLEATIGNNDTVWHDSNNPDGPNAWGLVKEDIPLFKNLYWHKFAPAWHYTRVGRGQYSYAQIADKALYPLGASVRVALMGEAYFMFRSGWTEGAARSARRLVQRFITQEASPTLSSVFAAQQQEFFLILPDVWSDNSLHVADSSAFEGENFGYGSWAYVPSLFPFAERDTVKMLDNEIWPDFYDNVTDENYELYKQDACNPGEYGVKLVPDKVTLLALAEEEEIDP